MIFRQLICNAISRDRQTAIASVHFIFHLWKHHIYSIIYGTIYCVRNAYEILVGKPEGKRPLGVLGIDGRIILERILGKLREVVDWIHLARNRDQWLAIVNAVMNIRVP
jgi:hypothetical protein